MITMNELVDLRMQQHIAHEIYRQQIMQRIPDPFPPLLPMSMPRHVIMPPRVTLPGVEVTLQNDDLWKQFHQIGTEMIITKSGRRMFPSMRLSLSGLEDETNYCILLEMVPIGDCRYKFSGSQWVPAGGAEPQSPQRMCLHPDSPATGAHWQAQPILFNKVKLTNNTLDNNGHIVLASMHKYQPRIHVIRTSDLAQIPWAPQQAFVFPETEFVAVTAYQNDRITKLKIDNNPFAKGFRETGQSRCKRKMSSSPTAEDQQQQQQLTPQLQQQHHQLNNYRQQQQQHRQQSPTKSLTTTAGLISESASSSSICMDKPAAKLCFPEHHLAHQQQHHQHHHLLNVDAAAAAAHLKRLRTNTSASSLDDSGGVSSGSGGGGGGVVGAITNDTSPIVNITPMDYINNTAGNIFPSPTITAVGTVNNNNNNGNNNGNSFASNSDVSGSCNATSVAFMHHLQQNMQSLLRPSLVDLACTYFARPQPLYPPHVYAVAAQHEALVAATQQQQQLSLPALTQATPSLLLPPHSSVVHDAATNLSADDDCAGTGAGAGGGDGDGELPNRVMAINSNTTLECITNDADLSSSDSSLIQDESNTAAIATPTPTPLTTPTAMSSSATCNTNDDTLFPSPSASNNNSRIICRNHNNNNNNNNNNGNNGHKAKRKGFSISAILGGGS